MAQARAGELVSSEPAYDTTTDAEEDGGRYTDTCSLTPTHFPLTY